MNATDSPVVEIRELGRPIRQVVVDRALEVGRECDGVVVADDGASRRHLKLLPSPLGLSVVDLGSRNGTLLNGVPLTTRRMLQPGDVLRLGRTEILMVHAPMTRSAPVVPPGAPAGPMSFPAPPAAPVVVAAPSRAASVLSSVFKGTVPPDGQPMFRTYLELPKRVPLKVWQAIRAVSVLAYLVLCVAMFVRPSGALFTFFGCRSYFSWLPGFGAIFARWRPATNFRDCSISARPERRPPGCANAVTSSPCACSSASPAPGCCCST